LASIRAVLETLEAGALSDPATARDFIARAETEVDRLTHMVAELLELSRIESGDMPAASEPVDIGVAVEEAVERLRSQALRAEVRLLAEVEAGLSPVTGDAERIERAVMNLVQNALKFTPAGGEVRVTAREESGEVRIEVADNGSGIDERDLPRIFERFYKADNSRRTVGSGLGLALVKHTAEAHGGKVSVESEMGRGSKFTISLPAAGRIPSKALAGTRGAE
jgi:two-component system phosphate regulon sensor histidine kinase PhoR